MYVLDIQKAFDSLKNETPVSDTEYGDSVNRVDRKLFDRFYRIMTAQSASELAGISPEEIMELFPYVSEYSQFFDEKYSLACDFPTVFRKTKGIRLERRIL